MHPTQLSLADMACHLLSGASPQRLVILCHGYGAPGTDLVPLGAELAGDGMGDAAYLFPEAPVQLEFGGRAWWHIDLAAIQAAVQRGELEPLLAREPEGLQEAAGQLRDLVTAACRKLAISPAHVVLGGFSQGAMLATEVALQGDPPLALNILSGNLLAAARWRAAAQVAPPVRVFQSHGRQDPVLPVEGARRLRDLLQEAGSQISYHEFDGGHTITLPVLQELASFLRSLS